MDITGRSLGRMLDWCHEQLIEGSKQGHRAQASSARLKDVLHAAKKLGRQAQAAKPDVGNRCAAQTLQVQALICGLQKFGIGETGGPRGCRHERAVGDEIYIVCQAVVGAGYSETSGVGSSNTASTNPHYAPQEEPLAPDQSASGFPDKNHSHRRRRRGRGRGQDDDRQPQKPNKPRSGLASARPPFGCPFYFHDKEEHRSCLNIKLRRIVDVRQHIYRCHVQPSYCPQCGIVFEEDINHAQRDAHVLRRNCEAASNAPRYPGATSDQLANMSNDATHRDGSTEEERWYAIWDIMFPHIGRPPSPYIDIWYEWSDAAIARYQQNGGPQDFIRQWAPGFDMLEFLNRFLYHFRDYDRVTFAITPNAGHARDVSRNTYIITAAQNTIPTPLLPSPPPLPLQIDSRSVLVAQPTILTERAAAVSVADARGVSSNTYIMTEAQNTIPIPLSPPRTDGRSVLIAPPVMLAEQALLDTGASDEPPPSYETYPNESYFDNAYRGYFGDT